jgi:PadR family transcriptional regulator, regulatory protein PadR
MPERSMSTDLLQGTLDLLILKTLSRAPMHGWGIAQRIRQISDEVFAVNQGSLYPALARLEHKGWVTGLEGQADNGRKVKMYQLTKLGSKQLVQEQANWDRVAGAMARILTAE